MPEYVLRPEFERTQQHVDKIFGLIRSLKDSVIRIEKDLEHILSELASYEQHSSAQNSKIEAVTKEVTRRGTIWAAYKSVVAIVATAATLTWSFLKIYQAFM